MLERTVLPPPSRVNLKYSFSVKKGPRHRLFSTRGYSILPPPNSLVSNPFSWNWSRPRTKSWMVDFTQDAAVLWEAYTVIVLVACLCCDVSRFGSRLRLGVWDWVYVADDLRVYWCIDSTLGQHTVCVGFTHSLSTHHNYHYSVVALCNDRLFCSEMSSLWMKF